MNYYEKFVQNSLVQSRINSEIPEEWFKNHGLALYLFKENASETPEVKKSKAIKKLQEKHLKRFTKGNIPAIKVEAIKNKVANARTEEGFNAVWNSYQFPSCDIRAIELVPVFKALAAKDIDTALDCLSQLSNDFLVQNDFWGSIITFIVAANSGDSESAKINMIRIVQFLQSFEYVDFMNYLVPYLVKTHLPESDWLWHFKTVEVELKGQVYYAMPIMIHNSSAEGGTKANVSWIDMKPLSSVHLEDAYGRKYQNAQTAIANTAMAGTQIAANLGANAIVQTASAIFNMVTNGKFEVLTHWGVKTLVLEKNTEIPLNSCGYIVTRNKAEFDSWHQPSNTGSIKNYDAFINFADGLHYKPHKGSDFEDASEILELLKKSLNG